MWSPWVYKKPPYNARLAQALPHGLQDMVYFCSSHRPKSQNCNLVVSHRIRMAQFLKLLFNGKSNNIYIYLSHIFQKVKWGKQNQHSDLPVSSRHHLITGPSSLALSHQVQYSLSMDSAHKNVFCIPVKKTSMSSRLCWIITPAGTCNNAGHKEMFLPYLEGQMLYEPMLCSNHKVSGRSLSHLMLPDLQKIKLKNNWRCSNTLQMQIRDFWAIHKSIFFQSQQLGDVWISVPIIPTTSCRLEEFWKLTKEFWRLLRLINTAQKGCLVCITVPWKCLLNLRQEGRWSTMAG